MNSPLRESVAAVLLCEGEIFGIRRQNHLTVFPGYTSFPGGKVDRQEREYGDQTREFFGRAYSERLIQALFRELREELGIDLFDLYKRGELKNLGLIGEASTPEFQSVRFQTYFFAIELERRPKLNVDEGEVDSWSWQSADEWLKLYHKGELLMVPPTKHVFEYFQSEGWPKWEESSRQDFNLRYTSTLHVPMLENVKGIKQYLPLSHTFPPANRTNCFLLGEDKKVLVDPSPKDTEEMEKLIRSIKRDLNGESLELIFLTHHHTDHYERVTELNRAFGVPLGMSRDTYDRILRQQGVDYFHNDEVFFFKEGDILCQSLEQEVKIYEVPGHDEGQLAFAPENMNWFLAGDLIQTVGTVVIGGEEGDMAKYFSSLKRVIDFDPRVVIPSHGIPVGGTYKVEQTLKHRQFREKQVKAELARGKSPGEIVDVVYEGIEARLRPFALKTVEAHIWKILEERG